MLKAELGHWNQFEVPRNVKPAAAAAPVEPSPTEDDGIESDVDLDDVEPVRGVSIAENREVVDFD